ncbi:MAG: hypothetical protein XE10_0737 [Methanoculleus marisnigri]|jgi:Predicted transcriptional regulators|uniref:Uncharacterized protein n=1 Tax=Methanoculleus marisnigri TaxID=2198 RepID=A0A101IVU1_9EURY|nr:hypothetical protein [Methanoculleus marisnigri]KUL02303.1 MAG: hypothetical protein XE10_0737 [Methanoculleus marisnigri]
MDRAKIEEYLAEVPAEIRSAVKPLDNDKAWAIYILLLKRQQMRFSEIKSEFNVKSSGDIDRYLKTLVNAGLVSKEARKLSELGNSEKAYYSPTNLGKSLLHGLFQNILPQARSAPQDRNFWTEVLNREYVAFYPGETEDRESNLLYRESSMGYKSKRITERKQLD